MIVGTARVVLGLPGNDSLKGKRRVSRRIIDRARNTFNVAIAEVDALDSHRRLVIGFAVVSNEHAHATSMLDKIMEHVASASGDTIVIDQRTELVHLGHGEHMGADDDRFGR